MMKQGLPEVLRPYIFEWGSLNAAIEYVFLTSWN
jgi:hypothetical protein